MKRHRDIPAEDACAVKARQFAEQADQVGRPVWGHAVLSLEDPGHHHKPLTPVARLRPPGGARPQGRPTSRIQTIATADIP